MEAVMHSSTFRCTYSSLDPKHLSPSPHNTTSQRNICSRSSFLRGSTNLSFKLPLCSSSPLLTSQKPSRSVIVMRHNAASGYATALAEIGCTENVLESINSDIVQLGSLLQDPEIYGFLANPTIKNEDKKGVLKNLADNAGFNPFTLNLLNLIIDRKRAAILKDIVTEFEDLYYKLTDTEVAIVTSAIKIDIARLAEIATKVQRMSGAKNVRMKNIVDPSLIAGFIVRYGKDGSRLIDMSVKSQLALISQQINSVQQPDSIAV